MSRFNSLECVTRLYERRKLTRERLEKHVQGFVRWTKGGLGQLLDEWLVYHQWIQAFSTSPLCLVFNMKQEPIGERICVDYYC